MIYLLPSEDGRDRGSVEARLLFGKFEIINSIFPNNSLASINITTNKLGLEEGD
jgi:hypothetical protein